MSERQEDIFDKVGGKLKVAMEEVCEVVYNTAIDHAIEIIRLHKTGYEDIVEALEQLKKPLP